jgi:5-methylcytosine-specific restriction endonuclease McrA
MNPFVHEKRTKLTPQQRAKLFFEHGGRCYKCEMPIRGVWHDEHEIALENGGTNAWSNRRVICDSCHKTKTAADHGKAAKGRAQVVAMVVPRQYRRKGPAIPGSRDSPWKRKLNGQIVRR